MPFKPSEGSAYRCDLRFPAPVGRIAKALGTTDKREFHLRVALLRDLYNSGQFLVLQAFRDGTVTIQELLAAKRERRLSDDDLMADLTLRRGLFDSIADAIGRSAAGASTIARYTLSSKKLARSGLFAADAQLRDLADLDWKAARRDWPGSPSDWNALRRMLSTVLTLVTGDVYHPFRRKVMKLIPRAAEPKGRTVAITLSIFLDVQARMPVHARPCVWALLLTGARAGEYLRMTPEHLDHETHSIRVPGTKTAASRSTVYVDAAHWPWIVMAVPSPLGYQRLFKWWKKAAREAGYPTLRLHDLRALHAIVALEEGAPIQDVQASLRHESIDMTATYVRQLGKGQVAGLLGDALTTAVGSNVLPFPSLLNGVVTGTGYAAGVARREGKRLDGHRARLRALLGDAASDSTTTSNTADAVGGGSSATTGSTTVSEPEERTG